MSEDKQRKIKYCVYCGSEVEKSKTYCPNCGKLIIKITPEKESTKVEPIQKLEVSRKCPNCGSIITSTILDQCPICNTELEKISEVKKAIIQKKPGLIFTDKKLEPEQKFVLKKDTWTLKEGINVFGTCIYILVIVFFLVFSFTSFQLETTPLTIQIILLSQIPELIFGIYPIWYIYNKKHSFQKLGFFSNSNKILIAVLIGILGALMLFLIDIFSDSFINFLSDVGFDFFNIKSSIETQNLVIRNSDLIWIILLALTLCIKSISSEIVFRGVLHNTLKQKFRNIYLVILIVALAYSLVYVMMSFTVGISFFLLNFIAFAILGLLYEINRNLYNTLIANVIFNIIIVIFIYL
ncbi:MAG: type II CAAX prenyl endopeptidase Rce1 family protein [Candidatus Thorarchaeota archaeon]